MLSARGQQLLFADADGATTFEDISKLQDNLKNLVKGNKEENKHYDFNLANPLNKFF